MTQLLNCMVKQVISPFGQVVCAEGEFGSPIVIPVSHVEWVGGIDWRGESYWIATANGHALHVLGELQYDIAQFKTRIIETQFDKFFVIGNGQGLFNEGNQLSALFPAHICAWEVFSEATDGKPATSVLLNSGNHVVIEGEMDAFSDLYRGAVQ